MDVPLSGNAAVEALATAVDDLMMRQYGPDAGDRAGGVEAPTLGVPDAGHGATGLLAAASGYLLTLRPDHAHALAWIRAGERALDYLLRVQRPTGRIDLRDCNYDSGPDTAFLVQLLCPMLLLARQRGTALPAAFAEKTQRLLRKAIAGLLDAGGFHTPNHRWVVASALALAGAVFPELQVREAVKAYTAEGIDIDADGAFIERSVAIYDAVSDRALLLLAQYAGFTEGIAAAKRNLQMNRHMLHADGTAETGLSHRQDYGTRVVPLGLASCALQASALERDDQLTALARWLWEKTSEPNPSALLWLVHALHAYDEPADGPAEAPDGFARHFPVNGLYRIRRGLMSASLFAGVTRLMTLTHGAAEIRSVKIAHAYFGVGRFVADDMIVSDGGVVLESRGQSRERRPGYDLPLGREVPRERFEAMRQERGLRAVPPCLATLTVAEAAGGLDLVLESVASLSNVALQIAIDFAPGGTWETDDTATMPVAGQVLFLKRGMGRMRYGHDVIEIGPGHDAHRMWAMRDAEVAPDSVRVLITLATPARHAWAIRCRRGV